ncbi:uncharacterized protein HMPREF1541_04543 [Cyphellophora europaea CBS 101466]|uniref:Mediator of RNA polymerase II transcription subunit 6 n=1 Tax=Cyphellophora europaea (strain CBS 101466) TaxID=1220924 RepID=W2RUZ9_CYPE1|nr:uncharacterized protein HMPREF1541_04543 [Cyphellophora europaea CBS 101466]ETN40267.1 hypothetical protein HMPREF1541_04543 [Cyphellophora europaea CBS 101466]
MAQYVYEDQSQQVFSKPEWVATEGRGSINHNNVLYYFMHSPFFEPGCRNAEVFDDRRDMDKWIRIIGTYKSFHEEMAKKPGVEYILLHDPEDANTMVDTASGIPERSSLYIIRKQRRHNAHSISPMAYYWCMGIRIFQAPCAANVLTPRILDLSTALNKSFEKIAQLSVFSATYGHTWEKPGQKSGKKTTAELGQQSKDTTPAPTQNNGATEGLGLTIASAAKDEEGDSRTLAQALRLTNQYRKEYADEVTLVGEPGNFRFSKDRGQAGLTATGQPRDGSRAATPLQSRAASVAMARQASASSKGGR